MIPPRVLLTALVIGIGCNFQWGYQLGVVNSMCPAALSLLNDSYTSQNLTITMDEISHIWSVGVNIFLFGALFGSVPATLVAEKLGRKNAIMVNNLLSVLGSLLCCLWPILNKFELFMAGRFIIGVHGGLNLVFASIYMSEAALIQHRGFLGSLQNSFMGVWLALAAILGLPNILGNKAGLTGLLILPGVISILFAVVFWFFPDTSKFLLLGKNDELAAEKSVAFFYRDERSYRQFLSELHHEKKCQEKDVKSSKNWIKSLLSAPKSVVFGMLVAVVVDWTVAFSGVVGIVNFSTFIFIETGIAESLSLTATVVLLTFNAFFAWIGSFAVAKLKRRTVLLSSIFGTLVANIVFVVTSELDVAQPKLCSNWCNWVKIVTVITFCCIYQLGIGSVALFLPNELVPQHFRSFTQSVGMSSLNILVITTGFALLPLSQQIRTLSMVVLYVVPTAFCFAFLWRFQPETKNKNITEVQESLELKFGVFARIRDKRIEKSEENSET